MKVLIINDDVLNDEKAHCGLLLTFSTNEIEAQI